MKIVIDIPEIAYEAFKEWHKNKVATVEQTIIANGIPISQGEWIEGKNGNLKCNQCGCEIRYSYLIGNKPDFPNFCCDCGADMRDREGE